MNRSAKIKSMIDEIEPGVPWTNNGRLYAENKHLHEAEEYQMGGAMFRVVSFFNAIAATIYNFSPTTNNNE